VAGKTGTAQRAANGTYQGYTGSFIGFAPADKPRIALAVLVENGGHGGTTAAPIARKVMDYYLLGKDPQSLPVLPLKSGVGD